MTLRRGSGILAAAALAVMLSGCASGGVDPVVSDAVASALSAARSAQLGLAQSGDGRILPTTLTALLGDMAESLADTGRELELHESSGAGGEEYRDAALTDVRAALEAVHVAQGPDPDAARDDLDMAIDQLQTLSEQP